MRLFEIIGDEEIEVMDGERVVGVYAPGLIYTCRSTKLGAVLDGWLAEGRARIVDERGGAVPASVKGHGQVR